MQITYEEKEAIIDEIAKRLMNICYMTAKKQARNAMDITNLNDISGDNTITFVFKVEMLSSDFLEVLGGLRRVAPSHREKLRRKSVVERLLSIGGRVHERLC